MSSSPEPSLEACLSPSGPLFPFNPLPVLSALICHHDKICVGATAAPLFGRELITRAVL